MRRVTDFAPIERAAIADLMTSLGPDAPTLCEGWTTRDLAAHLVVRATRVDAAAGILIPRSPPGRSGSRTGSPPSPGRNFWPRYATGRGGRP